jgi:ubiquinone/menaquinone biosynthesis C-methylase UbiE
MMSEVNITRDMLAKHHRDGERFADLMRETYSNRFNDTFWSIWHEHIGPALTGNGETVLDLGTGPGLFLQDLVSRYPGTRAVGVEVASYMLDKIDLPASCEIIEADLQVANLPLASNSVTAALASVVLHEMHQPVRALLEMQRVIKPGGLLFVLDWVRSPLSLYLETEADASRVFSADTPVAELEDIFIHFIEHNRFSADDLAFLLDRCGFDIVFRDSYNQDRFARLIGRRRES